MPNYRIVQYAPETDIYPFRIEVEKTFLFFWKHWVPLVDPKNKRQYEYYYPRVEDAEYNLRHIRYKEIAKAREIAEKEEKEAARKAFVPRVIQENHE